MATLLVGEQQTVTTGDGGGVRNDRNVCYTYTAAASGIADTLKWHFWSAAASGSGLKIAIWDGSPGSGSLLYTADIGDTFGLTQGLQTHTVTSPFSVTQGNTYCIGNVSETDYEPDLGTEFDASHDRWIDTGTSWPNVSSTAPGTANGTGSRVRPEWWFEGSSGITIEVPTGPWR